MFCVCDVGVCSCLVCDVMCMCDACLSACVFACQVCLRPLCNLFHDIR